MLTSNMLEGLRIVEYGEFISAPYCTKLMADLGAEVIKIEDPGKGGDPSRYYGPFRGDIPNAEKSGMFLWLNTNKKSITLNLFASYGYELFMKLLNQADVFIHNIAPRKAAEIGIDYQSLSKINDSLVVTAITSFGQDGPYSNFKACEINCSAAGGLSVATGEPDREPLVMPLSMGAYQAGVSAAGATLVAHLQTLLEGKGRFVDIAEIEVLANNHVGTHLLNYIYRGVGGIRRGHHGGYFYYPCACLPCKDGYVCLLAPQTAQWIKFVEMMGSPEWTKKPRYRNRRVMAEEYADESDQLLLPWLKQYTKEEIFTMAMENHVPFAPEKTIDELVFDPQLKARNFFRTIMHSEAGELTYPGAAFELSSGNTTVQPAPLLGQHNEHIFGQRLGYSDQQLRSLQEYGVI